MTNNFFFNFGDDYLQKYVLDHDGNSNGSWVPSYIPFCSRIQTYSIFNKLLLWDLIIFVPNLIFVVFLLVRWLQVKAKMRNIDFPILTVFYNLILLASLLSMTRCIVTTFIKPTSDIGILVNKVLWLIVRFGQLSTELSVVLFGLFFGRLESEKSIFRIMMLTIPTTLLYISIQAFLELLYPDKHYVVFVDDNHYYDLYGHGGMIFWFLSSSIFFLIYSGIFILPFTRFKTTFQIPTKTSFYIYCFVMAILCFTQLTGAAMTYADGGSGLCILDFTTYVNFTLFGPFVYVIFLRRFFQKDLSLSSRYLTDTDDSNISDNQQENTSLLTQPENIIIHSSSQKSLNRQLISSNVEETAAGSQGVINSYSSFRDEFSHRNLLSNPFDFVDSCNEDEDEDQQIVKILSGS